jgi:transcriptional regulator with XRE-family HTH domain
MSADQTCIALSTIPSSGETCIALSTVAPPNRGALPRPEKNSFGVASRNKMQFALAVVDPRIAAFDRARAVRGVSHQKLCAVAGINPATWRALRAGEQGPKPATLKRLEAVLKAVLPKPKVLPIAAMVRAAEQLLADVIARDPALVDAVTYRRANRKVAPATMAEGRLRTLALYVVAVEVEVGNADIAAALGMTRQNVHKARNMIEELADNPRVRSLLDHVAGVLRGEGA